VVPSVVRPVGVVNPKLAEHHEIDHGGQGSVRDLVQLTLAQRFAVALMNIEQFKPDLEAHRSRIDLEISVEIELRDAKRMEGLL
jgi:hypothetical protein